MQAESGVHRRWRTVQVFISSTFNDMHAERDHLVKEVFPELADWCERRRLRLVDVDLRWGVTEQDATMNANVVRTCLERIDDCRPFFVCLLGQRYGWTPGRDDLSPETFEKYPAVADAADAGASVTEMEILHAAIRPFRQEGSGGPGDDDYPAAEHALFYQRDPGYLADLPAEPPQLRRIYTDEVEADVSLRDRLLARQHALVEETVRPRRPVRSYRAHWDPQERSPELAIPTSCPALLAENERRWREGWEHILGRSLQGRELPADALAEADRFNERLTAGRFTDFTCEGGPLGAALLQDLKAAIERRFPRNVDADEDDDLQRDLDQQEEFLYTNSAGFIEREGDFAELDAYTQDASSQTLVLTAEGGMGKSMLLANWLERCRRQPEDLPNTSFHFRFIGQSDGSTTVVALLRSLLLELQEAGKLPATRRVRQMQPDGSEADADVPLEVPQDPGEVRALWREVLPELGSQGRTVILLDGVNELETGLSDRTWLPLAGLPGGVKVVLSFRTGSDDADQWRDQLAHNANARLTTVRPFDDPEARRELVRAYLRQYLKELDAAHVEQLIASPGATNPLFLKVVLSELRVFGAFGQLGERIRDEFGGTPVSAFDGVLRRLENDPGHRTWDPRRSVALLFGLLAHARHGLSVEELTGVFQAELSVSEAQARSAALVLLRQVRPFLARRSGRHDFFYESFLIAVRRRYVGETTAEEPYRRPAPEWHALLGGHYLGQPDDSPRKLAELPYHLLQAQMWEALEGTLTDLGFLEGKARAGLVHDLAADLRAAWQALPAERPWRLNLRLLEQALRRDLQFVARHPATLFQCLWNTAWWYDCPEAADHYDPPEGGWGPRGAPWERPEPKLCTLLERWRARKEAREPGFLWVRLVWAPQFPLGGAEIACLEGHTERVNTIAFSPDEKLMVSGSGFSTYTNPGGTDDTVRVWDTAAGMELACLRGHEAPLKGAAFCADGTRIMSTDHETVRVWEVGAWTERVCLSGGSTQDPAWRPVASPARLRVVTGGGANGPLLLWDAERGVVLAQLAASGRQEANVVFSDDGRRIVSGDVDRVRVWDAADGVELACLTGHQHYVYGTAFRPDGCQVVSGAADHTVRLWDVAQAMELACLWGHQDRVRSVAITPDGTRIVSGSEDKTVRLWGMVDSGRPYWAELLCLEGHEYTVHGVALVLGGSRVVSRDDRTVRLWDARTGVQLICLDKLPDAGDWALSPDGTRLAAVVGSGPFGALRLWDVETGAEAGCLRGHGATVSSVTFSPTGRWIASGSMTGQLRLWDAGAAQGLGQPRREGRSALVYGLAIAPDGCRVASGQGHTGRHSVWLWDLRSGAGLRHFEAEGLDAYHVVFSPDGSMIASGDGGPYGAVRLWDVESGASLGRLLGHTGGITRLAFSPDGSRVVSGSYDGTVRVWDTAHGRSLEVIEDPGEKMDVQAVAGALSAPEWRAERAPGETAIQRVQSGETVAWFHGEYARMAIGDGGRTWACASGSDLVVLALEGQPLDLQSDPALHDTCGDQPVVKTVGSSSGDVTPSPGAPVCDAPQAEPPLADLDGPDDLDIPAFLRRGRAAGGRQPGELGAVEAADAGPAAAARATGPAKPWWQFWRHD